MGILVLVALLIYIIVLIINLGVHVSDLQTAVSRLQSSVSAAISKIDSLKAGQVDPTALASAVTSLNALSDALDAKVAA